MHIKKANRLYPFLTRDGAGELIVVRAAYDGVIPWSIVQVLVRVIRNYEGARRFFPNARAEAAFDVVFQHLEHVIKDVMPCVKPDDPESWMMTCLFNKLIDFIRSDVDVTREEHAALLKAEYDSETWDISEEDYAEYADFYEAQRSSRYEIRRQAARLEIIEIWPFLMRCERMLFIAYLLAEGTEADAARLLKMPDWTFRRYFDRACLRARAIFMFQRKTLNLRKMI